MSNILGDLTNHFGYLFIFLCKSDLLPDISESRFCIRALMNYNFNFSYFLDTYEEANKKLKYILESTTDEERDRNKRKKRGKNSKYNEFVDISSSEEDMRIDSPPRFENIGDKFILICLTYWLTYLHFI